MRRVVYMVDESVDHPVLQSQSLSVIGRLLEDGTAVDLLITNATDEAHEQSVARKFLGPAPRIAALSKRHVGSSLLAKVLRTIRRASARRRAAEFLAQALQQDQLLLLHARGSAAYLGAHLRGRFRGTRLVVDVRGDGAAEARFASAGRSGERAARLVDRMDARVFPLADHVICVSHPLLAEMRRRFAIACEGTVIPCVADERRFFPDSRRRLEARASLGLSTEPLIVYAGSLGPWHEFETTLDTLDAVAGRNGGARFLVATRDTEKAAALVAARPGLKDRVLVRGGDADAVARWLNAADIGLLLREPHPLNHGACPTKFAEYVLSGLSVVASEGIGDVGGWVRGLDLGVCVPGVDSLVAAAACSRLIESLARGDDREGRVRRASPVLSLGARLRNWNEAYLAALERPPA